MRAFVAFSAVFLALWSVSTASVVTVRLTKQVNTDARRTSEFPAVAARSRIAYLKSRTTSGHSTVPTTNQVTFYTTVVEIGGTVYNLLLDTGSSNTWCGAGRPYNRTSTSIPTGQLLNITYGSVSTFMGYEYLDQVTIAPGLNIKNQSIGSVLLSYSSNTSTVDGILGVGPVDLTNGTVSPGNNALIPTVMNNLVAQGLIQNQVLGVYFSPSTTNESETNGALTYGGYDSSLFEGELTYVPVTTTLPSSKYWGINITLSVYGNTKIISTSTAGVVDTGSTQILLADDFFEIYMQAIPGATWNETVGLLEIPASSIPSMQPLCFTIAGKVFTLDVAAQLVPKNQNIVWGGDPGKYYGVIANLGSLIGEQGLDFILGMAFVERYYSVFDTDNNRVGFAPTKYTHTAYSLE